MQRALGAGLVVIGIVLGILGLDANDSVSSRLSRLFTGSPTDKTVWLFIGGIVAVVAGLSLALFPRRRDSA